MRGHVGCVAELLLFAVFHCDCAAVSTHFEYSVVAVEHGAVVVSFEFVVGPQAHFVDEMAFVVLEGDGLGIGCFVIVVVEELSPGGADGVGVIDAESPSCEINVMDTVVGDVSGSIVPEPMPVVMPAIGGECVEGGGSKPFVVVDAFGRGCGFRASDGSTQLVVDGFRDADLAELPVAHELDAGEVAVAAPTLRSVLNDFAVAFRGSFEVEAFGDGVAAGLLDVDVFASFECCCGDGGVPVIRGGDADRVDVGVAQDFCVVAVSCDVFGYAFDLGGVDIAYGDDFAIGLRGKFLDVGACASAHTNDRVSKSARGGFSAGVRGEECCGGDAEGGCGHEFAAGEVAHVIVSEYLFWDVAEDFSIRLFVWECIGVFGSVDEYAEPEGEFFRCAHGSVVRGDCVVVRPGHGFFAEGVCDEQSVVAGVKPGAAEI